MSDDAKVLLEAEQAVQSLLTEVEALKAQAGSYSEARGDIQAVRSDAQQLLQRLTTVSQRLKDLVDTVSGIGTAEILRRVDAIGDTSEKLESVVSNVRLDTLGTKQRVEDLEKSGAARSDDIIRRLQSDITKVGGSVEAAEAAVQRQMQAEAAKVVATLEAFGTSRFAQVGGAVQSLEKRVDALEKTLRAKYGFQIVVLLFIALVAIAGLLVSLPPVRAAFGW